MNNCIINIHQVTSSHSQQACNSSTPTTLPQKCAASFLFWSGTGIRDYCQRYGGNIQKVCEEEGGPRPLAGKTLDTVEEALCQMIPLDKLGDRRKWRDERLAALALHKQQQELGSKDQ